MASLAQAGKFFWPEPIALVAFSANPTNTAFTVLDAAGEYQATIQCASESMVISHVGMKLNAVAGSPTADIRIETVDASGNPSGTLWGTNTNIVTPTLTTSWTVHALTASASISRGQIWCLKVVYNSGTSITMEVTAQINDKSCLPYKVTNTSGSAVKTVNVPANPGLIRLAVGSSSSSFYFVHGLGPITNNTSATFNNTNNEARGMRFQVPFKARCIGLIFYTRVDIGDFNCVIYDDSGAEVSGSSTAIDGDLQTSGASAAARVYFDNPVTLSAATWYRAVIEPTTATNVGSNILTLGSASTIGATPWRQNAHYTVRVSGAWDDSHTDQIWPIGLILDQLSDGRETFAVQSIYPTLRYRQIPVGY